MARKSGAWGLAVDGVDVHLVRVVRHGRGCAVDRIMTRRADAAERWPEAVDAMRDEIGSDDHDPLVLCLPNDQAIHRRLRLPSTDEATTHQMVAAQLEIMLADQARTFSWAALSNDDVSGDEGGDVWLCAARTDAVERLRGAVDALRRPVAGAVTAAFATWSGLSRLLDRPDRRTILVDLPATGGTTVIVGDAERLGDITVIAEAADDFSEPAGDRDPSESGGAPPPSIDDWARQVRESCDEMLDGVDAEGRPTECLFVGHGARLPGVVDALRAALGIDVNLIDRGHDGKRLEGGALAAAGAAAACLADTPMIEPDPAGPGAVPTRRRFGFRRVRVALLAWLVILVAGTYLLDLAHARRLERLVAQSTADEAGGADLDRRLAVGAYLRRGGPPVLAILDEIGDVTPQPIVLDSFQYARSGEVRLRGKAPNNKEFSQYLEKIAAARSFDTANLVHQEVAGKKKKKIKFDVAAAVSRWDGRERRKTPEPSPETPNPKSEHDKTKPEARTPKTEPGKPDPQTQNPEPETRKAEPESTNPKPERRKPERTR
ncbi:MAG: hypothetical protein CMJ18_13950 [Phycisphaeraceae bacterium]|nr:hypothetical protein [Phycisphaeraceae bacterium]